MGFGGKLEYPAFFLLYLKDSPSSDSRFLSYQA